MTPTDIFALGRPALPPSGAEASRAGKTGDTAVSDTSDFEKEMRESGAKDREPTRDEPRGARAERMPEGTSVQPEPPREAPKDGVRATPPLEGFPVIGQGPAPETETGEAVTLEPLGEIRASSEESADIAALPERPVMRSRNIPNPRAEMAERPGTNVAPEMPLGAAAADAEPEPAERSPAAALPDAAAQPDLAEIATPAATRDGEMIPLPGADPAKPATAAPDHAPAPVKPATAISAAPKPVEPVASPAEASADIVDPVAVPSAAEESADLPPQARQVSTAAQAERAAIAQSAPIGAAAGDVQKVPSAPERTERPVEAAPVARKAPSAPEAPKAAADPAGPTPATAQSDLARGAEGEARSFEHTLSLESGRGPSWRLGADPVGAAQMRAADMQAAAPGRALTVGQQLSVAVSSAQNGQVELRLDPAELGRVQIHLHTSEDGVRAVVMAERAETQDLLRRHADMLSRDLAEAGFESVSLDFTGGSHSGDQPDDASSVVAAQAEPGITGADLPAPLPEAPARYRQGSGQTSLDIRL